MCTRSEHLRKIHKIKLVWLDYVYCSRYTNHNIPKKVKYYYTVYIEEKIIVIRIIILKFKLKKLIYDISYYVLWNYNNHSLFDERSDGCIDFKMMYFLCLRSVLNYYEKLIQFSIRTSTFWFANILEGQKWNSSVLSK